MKKFAELDTPHFGVTPFEEVEAASGYAEVLLYACAKNLMKISAF